MVLQPKKRLEARPIQHLELQRLVRQVVQLLQQQQLDHQRRRVRRPAAATGRPQGQLRIHRRRDPRKVDMLAQHRQRIVQLLTLRRAFLADEQADHAGSEASTGTRGILPVPRRKRQVFRGSQ